MRHPLARRLLAGAAAIAAACALATPARAAAPPSLDIILDDMTIAALHGDYVVDPHVSALPQLNVSNAKLTYELSGLTGVSLSDDFRNAGPLEQPCTVESRTKLVCGQESMLVPGDDDYMQARLTPAATAPTGQSGTLKVTFEADNVPAVTKSVTVEVDEGVDLATGSRGRQVYVKPGASWDETLELTSISGNVVHGASVSISAPRHVAAPKQFSNCRYLDGSLQSCSFDQDLRPGIKYRIVLPFRVRPDAFAPGLTDLTFLWYTAAEWDNIQNSPGSGNHGEAGTGGKLTLEPLTAALTRTKTATLTRTKQIDVDRSNNFQQMWVNVTGKHSADIEALGATASGPAGGTATVKIGLRNNGPVTLDSERNGWEVAYVSIPLSTPVVTIPKDCANGNPYLAKPGTKLYVCKNPAQYFFPKTAVTWSFEVKVGTGAATATGRVEANPNDCDLDDDCSRYFDYDTDPSNNLAPIVITEVTAGTGGTGGGDGLAITGPRTALVAGVGALLVAAGALLLIRRRRTRFEA
ncbi:hypothetical protein ACIA5D_20435 [Actinoplanes sp. NPDC051513]|uniref:hypothetical protein n=1 Tax=Actinoplanes sp. NPDC051513 TaxID=3363908 RepID=UPI003797BFD6